MQSYCCSFDYYWMLFLLSPVAEGVPVGEANEDVVCDGFKLMWDNLLRLVSHGGYLVVGILLDAILLDVVLRVYRVHYCKHKKGLLALLSLYM